jgi:hypothetical protein
MNGDITPLALYVSMACTGETFTFPESLRGSAGLVGKGCTMPARYIAQANKFPATAPNICRLSVRNLLYEYINLLTSRIYQVALKFLENCPLL